MFENKNSRCRNCRFWWPTGEGAGAVDREHAIFGQCRYEAPVALINDLPDHRARYTSWASTKRDDWCGRHMHVTG
jgi:hypothetical protein